MGVLPIYFKLLSHLEAVENVVKGNPAVTGCKLDDIVGLFHLHLVYMLWQVSPDGAVIHNFCVSFS